MLYSVQCDFDVKWDDDSGILSLQPSGTWPRKCLMTGTFILRWTIFDKFWGQILGKNLQAGAILGNPQLALWHSFNNEAPGDFGVSENI